MEDKLLIGGLVAFGFAAVALLLWVYRGYFQLILNFIVQLWRTRAQLNPMTRQGRWRLLGLVLNLLGGLLFLEALFPVLDEQNLFTESAVLFVPAILLIYIGWKCHVHSKRFGALPATQVVRDDNRAPVVYLRSFEDDAKVAQTADLTIGMTGLQFNNEEGVIASIFSDLGPLLAIGRPGEEIPYFGAAREYLAGVDWHERVRILLAQAAFVIIRAGDTPGLWWEIGECAKGVRPQRLVFLIPFKRRQYDEFRRKAAEYLPCRLPEYAGQGLPATSLRAALFFDPDWTPHILPLQETLWQYMWRNHFGGIDPSELSAFRKLMLIVLAVMGGYSSIDVSGQSNLQRVLRKTLLPVLQR